MKTLPIVSLFSAGCVLALVLLFLLGDDSALVFAASVTAKHKDTGRFSVAKKPAQQQKHGIHPDDYNHPNLEHDEDTDDDEDGHHHTQKNSQRTASADMVELDGLHDKGSIHDMPDDLHSSASHDLMVEEIQAKLEHEENHMSLKEAERTLQEHGLADHTPLDHQVAYGV